MTYAIVESGGNQIWVEPGRFYDVDRLGIDPDEPFNFERVLLINHDGEVHVGQPYIEGAIVEGTVMSHLRGRKILVYKMRPKKKTRKRQGHRQDLTRIMIDSITLGSVSLTSVKEEEDLPISEAELESQAAIEVEAEVEIEVEAESQAWVEAEAEVEIEVEAEDQAEVEAEVEVDAETESVSQDLPIAEETIEAEA